MLITSNEYSRVFLEQKRLLLDSCVLIELAQDQRTKEVLHCAHKTYSFFFCNVSLLEVGFGPPEKVEYQQDQVATMIYCGNDVIPVDNTELHKRKIRNIKDPLRAVFSYNPNSEEWYAARYLLIKVMNETGTGGKRTRELSNDAIIFNSSWNSRSALITNNTRDFCIFNKIMSDKNHKHKLPIFTIDDLGLSLDQDISFPENLI